jgi:catechol 2,3-dioxygenase-like lactoylglutathione lyase family enzyme
MIGYVTIGTSDLERARAYYTELLAPLGASLQMDIGDFIAFGTAPDQPMLSITLPYNGQAADPGNGNMVAIAPGSQAMVGELHALALSLGGSDEGPPGPRGDGFYGAYFRDLDGNKLCFFHLG